MNNEFYVYVLLDPRISLNSKYIINKNVFEFNYKPFYVGKGKNSRINQHFSKYNLKKNTEKNNTIKKILLSGCKPIGVKLFENLSETNAYLLEIEIISMIGLSNLTNKTIGGIGQCSESIKGEKNPMFGKHPIPWNKGLFGILVNSNKGKHLEDIVGYERANEIKTKLSIGRKGKSWEEYFGKEKANFAKQKRSELRKGVKHTEETINKMKLSSTPEIRLKRKISVNVLRQKKFDLDMNNNYDKLKNLIDLGFNDIEIINRISAISKFRLKKMLYLIRNNLTSNYYFNTK